MKKKVLINCISPFTKDMLSINGKATAYVYMNHACEHPTTDIAAMMELLNKYKG